MWTVPYNINCPHAMEINEESVLDRGYVERDEYVVRHVIYRQTYYGTHGHMQQTHPLDDWAGLRYQCVKTICKLFVLFRLLRNPLSFACMLCVPLWYQCKHDDVIKWKHFRITGPLWGEVPLTKASDAGLWCFLWSAPDQKVEESKHWRFMMTWCSLWGHCNDQCYAGFKSMCLISFLSPKILMVASWSS